MTYSVPFINTVLYHWVNLLIIFTSCCEDERFHGIPGYCIGLQRQNHLEHRYHNHQCLLTSFAEMIVTVMITGNVYTILINHQPSMSVNCLVWYNYTKFLASSIFTFQISNTRCMWADLKIKLKLHIHIKYICTLSTSLNGMINNAIKCFLS